MRSYCGCEIEDNVEQRTNSRPVVAGERIEPARTIRYCSCNKRHLTATGRIGVRFAHASILVYDEHVIDLYHRICALYRMG
jgi:hypothetical protein